MSKRYIDLLSNKKEETRTSDEVISSIKTKLKNLGDS